MQFVIGFILGIVWCNIGFSGMARIVDNGLDKIQSSSKEIARDAVKEPQHQ
jgi:hypothetical protein